MKVAPPGGAGSKLTTANSNGMATGTEIESRIPPWLGHEDESDATELRAGETGKVLKANAFRPLVFSTLVRCILLRSVLAASGGKQTSRQAMNRAAVISRGRIKPLIK